MVLDCMGKGKVIIPRGRYVAVLHQGVVEVPVEGPLYFGHIGNFSNAPNTDLLSSVGVRLRLRHRASIVVTGRGTNTGDRL